MTKKLKLKGRNADRIKPEQKKKMQKTLDTMKETRDKDSLNLRDVAKAKLEWARAERERGISANKKIQIQIHKLDGIITVLEDLLGINSKEK